MVDLNTVSNLAIPAGAAASWNDGIPRIEDGWPPSGGIVDPPNDSGIANWQPLLLGENCNWLKHRVETLGATLVTLANANEVSTTGFAEIAAAASGNPAPGHAGGLFHVEGSNGKARQIVVSDNGATYARVRINSTPTWSPWHRIWDSGAASASLASIGYQVFPSGLILQWGHFSTGDAANEVGGSVVFPTAFPTSCFQVIPGSTAGVTAQDASSEGFQTTTISATGFAWKCRWQSRQSDLHDPIRWVALGR